MNRLGAAFGRLGLGLCCCGISRPSPTVGGADSSESSGGLFRGTTGGAVSCAGTTLPEASLFGGGTAATTVSLRLDGGLT